MEVTSVTKLIVFIRYLYNKTTPFKNDFQSMNFLAHIYLSGDETEVLVGNFIGDWVKGRQLEKYPHKVQKGIFLHRSIDAYTDQHPTVRASKRMLRTSFGHYAAVIVDVFYDHFLAHDWAQYSHQDLQAFTRELYPRLQHFHHTLPKKGQLTLEYMSRDNWLYHYREVEGIARALEGIARRTTFDSGMEGAVHHLRKDYDIFREQFHAFFPDVIRHAQSFLAR
jgi:acyl carrier protein phosphodiesterase